LERLVLLGEQGRKTFGEVNLNDVASSAGMSGGFYGARLEDVHKNILAALKKKTPKGEHAVQFGSAVKTTSVTKASAAGIPTCCPSS